VGGGRFCGDVGDLLGETEERAWATTRGSDESEGSASVKKMMLWVYYAFSLNESKEKYRYF
jgi:hypothetical protein